MWNSELIHSALRIATKAHEGQTRKYTGELYIVHPINVARTVSLCHGVTEQTIAAALCHDVLEDTDVEPEELADHIGEPATLLVMELTKRAEDIFPHYNRKARKDYEADRLRFVSPEAQTIKVADLIDNTRSIALHDHKFAAMYLVEKEHLLSYSLIQADPLLRHMAGCQIADAWDLIDKLEEQS